MRGVALSDEANKVLLFEVVALDTVCEVLPRVQECLETCRNLLIVAFLVGIQVSVEGASDDFLAPCVNFGNSRSLRVTILPQQGQSICLKLEAAIHPAFKCLTDLLCCWSELPQK